MAKISNTVAYPGISDLKGEDYLVITDADNNLMTKTVTINQVQALFGIDTLVAHVTINTGSLLTLGDTSITLIPAPGAGKTIDLISLNTYLDYNTEVYDFGNDLDFAVGAYTIATMPLAAANVGASEVRKINIIPGTASSKILEDNVALVLETGANPTTGNSALYVNIFYRVLNIGTSF